MSTKNTLQYISWFAAFALASAPVVGLAQSKPQSKTANQPSAQTGNGQARQELSGNVKDVRQATVRQSKDRNTIVLLETESGQNIAVDLGPTIDLKEVRIKKGIPITVGGSLVNVNGKPVFMANEVKVGERITRRTPTQPQRGSRQAANSGNGQKQRGPEATFTGRITQIRDVGVMQNKTQHTVAILQTPAGRKVYLDLGPSDALQRLDLEKGDQVKVSGTGHRHGGRAVLEVAQVESDGNRVNVKRNGHNGKGSSNGNSGNNRTRR